MKSAGDANNPWRSATDPASGKVYYYNVKTRESRWDKPPELCTAAERQEMLDRERRQRQFFGEMERNIRRTLQQGLSVADIDPQTRSPRQNTGRQGDPSPILSPRNSVHRAATAPNAHWRDLSSTISGAAPVTGAATPAAAAAYGGGAAAAERESGSDGSDAPSNGKRLPGEGESGRFWGSQTRPADGSASAGLMRPQRLCRTISTMDDSVLRELSAVATEEPAGAATDSSAARASPPGVPGAPPPQAPGATSTARFGDGGFGARGKESFGAWTDVRGKGSDARGRDSGERALRRPASDLQGAMEGSARDRFFAGAVDPWRPLRTTAPPESPALARKGSAASSGADLSRRNSTSTLYVGPHDTMSDPDRDATIRCVCAVFRAHIIEAMGTTVTSELYSTFDDPVLDAADAKSRFYVGGGNAHISAGEEGSPESLTERSTSTSMSAAAGGAAAGAAAATASSSREISGSAGSAGGRERGRNRQKNNSEKNSSERNNSEKNSSAAVAVGRRSRSRGSAERRVSFSDGIAGDALSGGRRRRWSRSGSRKRRSSGSSVSSMGSSAAPPVDVPSLAEITDYFRNIFYRSQLNVDCIILSLIYVERLLKETSGELRPAPRNWKSLLMSTLILSSKVWDDMSMWNADFVQICQSYTLTRINELEVAVLEALKFNVKVAASEYAKYYFLLRSMCARSGLGGDNTHVVPLDVAGARKLEALSSQLQSTSVRSFMRLKKSTTIHVVEDSRYLERVGRSGYHFVDRAPVAASLEEVVHDMQSVEADAIGRRIDVNPAGSGGGSAAGRLWPRTGSRPGSANSRTTERREAGVLGPEGNLALAAAMPAAAAAAAGAAAGPAAAGEAGSRGSTRIEPEAFTTAYLAPGEVGSAAADGSDYEVGTGWDSEEGITALTLDGLSLLDSTATEPRSYMSGT